MDADVAQKWLAQYRSVCVTSLERMAHGYSNDSFFVSCASGQRYVIRRLREQTVDRIEVEMRIQNLLNANGVACPIYERLRNGSVIGRDNQSVFTIAAYIVGETPSIVTLRLVRSLGATLARIHDILDPIIVAVTENPGQGLTARNAAAEIARCNTKASMRVREFIPNEPDDEHCLQACFRMAVQALRPDVSVTARTLTTGPAATGRKLLINTP